MGKTLKADIIIGGKVDKSLYGMGAAIENIGSMVNQVSEKLIDFGKESTKAYVSYEDAMLDAEVALRTQYESASELGRVMAKLETTSLQWARDSRFTTQDVAQAISNAAHAGWDLEQILNGVPSAMKIALAGGMELSQGLEYMVDISNAAGIGFEDLGNLVDYWAYAANKSSTTIPEMGAAMQKMGATMQFVKGDMAGLTTMLAVLANNGTKGTEAGTLLKNAFIRLIAPTKKASEAMEALDLTAEELDEIYSDNESIENAVNLLEEAGFSAYDSEGNLKSFLNIFQELNAATQAMSEADRNGILAAIFPTRTITGALALLDAAQNGYDGLYDSIVQFAEGYGSYASETMESGLGGVLRHLESVYNTLQTRTGKSISDDVGAAANAISELLESINGMDDGKFNAIVGGLEGIAVLGPGLLIAGGAMKALAMLFTPTGAIAAGAVAMAGFAGVMRELSEAAYESQFGSLTVDESALAAYVSGMGEKFTEAQGRIDGYRAAVLQAVEEYTNDSSSLKSGLINAMLTGATLTEDQVSGFRSLGDSIGQEMIAGINGSFSATAESLSYFTDGMDSDAASGIMALIQAGYESSIAQAEDLSQQLRSAMTSAFLDKQLTAEEVAGIQAIFDEINQLMAFQQDAHNAAEREKIMRQAQNLGIGGIEQITDLVNTQKKAELAAAEEWYWQLWESTKAGALAEGLTDAETAARLAEVDALYAGKRGEIDTQGLQLMMNAYQAAIQGSDLSDAFLHTESLARGLVSGSLDRKNAHWQYQNQYGNNAYAGEADWGNDNVGTLLGKFLEGFVDEFGGITGMQNTIAALNQQGNTALAKQLTDWLFMEQIANNYTYGRMGSNRRATGEDILNQYITPEGVPVDLEPNTTELDAAISARQGTDIAVNLVPRRGNRFYAEYAEGGRATEASIFGEAGAEWAIPEEHTDRTAWLLDAARKASGFTWPELLQRNGGLNGGSGGNMTLVYSPTINAGSAAGLDAVLRDDKNRMEKWLRDQKLRDSVEEY